MSKNMDSGDGGKMYSVSDIYGENVFNLKTMKEYLSDKAYRSLLATIQEGRSLEPGIADEVADAMKTWAISRGATHFTHWFQPLTGTTAEKHDAFIMPDHEGGVTQKFSSKELILGEPDASSFPSGGLRTTFEARGYTAWDPTSPAFVKEGDYGSTLCIPSVFCGYHGESLDKKTPLLRSVDALSEQVARLGRLFGVEGEKRAMPQLGVEQEYFLVDAGFYESRIDLLQAGRTLFGKAPAKHQQMEDHYFGAVKRRVLSFMEELDHELWRSGIPAKTRHNEVCPAQFEVAMVFEDLNLAVDHNMLAMEILTDVAETHGFACLLHEKPFHGVNGSGKHNNWSVRGTDGRNWLQPGQNPHEDAKFLTLLCSIIMAVDRHQDILRASVATAGNDLRLGGHEAPPAILSIYLGDQLAGILERIRDGGEPESTDGGVLNLGISSLPHLTRDATDRNRTSPFAFTGNKFEFRAVGSSQSCADANMVLNTIVAEALDDICSRAESEISGGKNVSEALRMILKDVVTQHGRIVFNGDSYTDEWRKEAEKRNLRNIEKTPEALESLIDASNMEMFNKYKVLTSRELQSRREVYRKEYETVCEIEAECAANIIRTMIIPASVRHCRELAGYIDQMSRAGIDVDLSRCQQNLKNAASLCEKTLEAVDALENRCEEGAAEIIDRLQRIRDYVDQLEAIIPDDIWPLPSYAEMMFMM
ncbi:MAG: glutamine synthetase III [Verrucomicrobiota bacterium]